MVNFRPKKYCCTTCNRCYRRNKQLYNHLYITGCKGLRKARDLSDCELVDLELMNMKANIYYNTRPYNFSGLQSGNRHYCTGIVLPTISKDKYSRAAI